MTKFIIISVPIDGRIVYTKIWVFEIILKQHMALPRQTIDWHIESDHLSGKITELESEAKYQMNGNLWKLLLIHNLLNFCG